MPLSLCPPGRVSVCADPPCTVRKCLTVSCREWGASGRRAKAGRTVPQALPGSGSPSELSAPSQGPSRPRRVWLLWEFPSPGESNQRASEPQVAVLSRQRPDCVRTRGPVTCRRADGHVQALSLWRPLSMVLPCSPGPTTQVPHSCLDPRSLWPPAALVTSVCPFVGCRMLEEPSLSHTVPRVCSGSVWARRPHKRLAFSLSCKRGGKARTRAVLIPTLLRPTIWGFYRPLLSR